MPWVPKVQQAVPCKPPPPKGSDTGQGLKKRPPVAATSAPGALEVRAAKALAEFVRKRGGSMSAADMHLALLYKQRPDLKGVVGRNEPSIRRFCSRHQGLLTFKHVPGKPGLVVAKPSAEAAGTSTVRKEPEAKREASLQEGNAVTSRGQRPLRESMVQEG